MTFLLAVVLMMAPDDGHGHGAHDRGHDAGHAEAQARHGRHGHGGHGKHGNPEDLASYIARMEEPGRAEWQKPDEVVAALAPKAGQVVCDIGAGPGYFALRFARAVGETGTVYAVDVEPQMTGVLRDRLVAAKVRNVVPVLAAPDDPFVPAKACDLVVVVDTYHHFPDGIAYLRRLARSLKPGGRLVNIDFHRRDLPVGPPVDHKVSREAFLADAKAAGLTLVKEHGFLPYQYFLEFEAR